MVNNYIKVFVHAGSHIPASLAATCVRGPDAIDSLTRSKMEVTRRKLNEDGFHFPQYKTNSPEPAVWSWVFPFDSRNPESLGVALTSADNLEAELVRREHRSSRCVYRAVPGLDLEAVRV